MTVREGNNIKIQLITWCMQRWCVPLFELWNKKWLEEKKTLKNPTPLAPIQATIAVGTSVFDRIIFSFLHFIVLKHHH